MLIAIFFKNLGKLEIKKDLFSICYPYTLIVVAAYNRYTHKMYPVLQSHNLVLFSLFIGLLFMGLINTYEFSIMPISFVVAKTKKTLNTALMQNMLLYSLISQNQLLERNTNQKCVVINKKINNKHQYGRSISFLCVKAPSMFQCRHMFKSTIRSTTFLTRSCTITFQKATLTNEAAKLKGKAAEDLSNDDKKNHTHRIVEICPKFECPKKHCVNPCALPIKRYIDGHHTHNPPSHKPSKLISNIDVNGDSKPQHFVKCNPRTEIKKNYKANEIKFDKKTKTYIDANHDKYEN